MGDSKYVLQKCLQLCTYRNILLNLCICRILDLLIPLTNRVCDTEPNKVSPVYSAVLGGHEECLEMLLQSGYSPDAQMCLVFGFSSPLCMAFQKKYVYLLCFYSFWLCGDVFPDDSFMIKQHVLGLTWELKNRKTDKNKSLYDVPLIV